MVGRAHFGHSQRQMAVPKWMQIIGGAFSHYLAGPLFFVCVCCFSVHASDCHGHTFDCPVLLTVLFIPLTALFMLSTALFIPLTALFMPTTALFMPVHTFSCPVHSFDCPVHAYNCPVHVCSHLQLPCSFL